MSSPTYVANPPIHLRPKTIAPSRSRKPQSPRYTNIYLPQKKLPLWALITFGCLLLFQLGWGVFSFNDVPEAHDELMKEIQEAREDLTRKGVEVD